MYLLKMVKVRSFSRPLATGKRENQLLLFQALTVLRRFHPMELNSRLCASQLGNPDIWVMDLASRKLERITKHYAIDTEPQWTIDGQSLILYLQPCRGATDLSGQPGVKEG